jgi:hypothetical protein
MIKFILPDEQKENEIRINLVKTRDGSIILQASKEHVSCPILKLGTDGIVYRYEKVPKDIGFVLVENGRIMIDGPF